MKKSDQEKARRKLENKISWVNNEIELQQEILRKNTNGTEKVVGVLENWKSDLNNTIQDTRANKPIESEREELKASIRGVIGEMEDEKFEVEGFPISERQLNRKKGQIIQELKTICAHLES
ncbi:MAG: hypothetical protein R6U38_00655 [Desulfatiglandaceae bacterium]